jgi:hypothetical protein
MQRQEFDRFDSPEFRRFDTPGPFSLRPEMTQVPRVPISCRDCFVEIEVEEPEEPLPTYQPPALKIPPPDYSIC